MRSRILPQIVVLAGFVLPWVPCTVLANQMDFARGRGSTTFHLYGLFSPSVFSASGQSGTSWGGGGSIQWGLDDRWAVSIDAARIESDGKRVSPFVAGVIHGPKSGARIRPWVEAGAGYYRLTDPATAISYFGTGGSGNFRDYLGRGSVKPDARDAVGGYFGAGLNWQFSSRLGMGTGVRAHNWAEFARSSPSLFTSWDGMLTLRTGLSYRL